MVKYILYTCLFAEEFRIYRGFSMKIERVDENTIKCYISTEEMEKYQIEYTDFLSRTDKAQELMKTIIRQAHEEVGYIPPKYAFEMQIMMVPDQGMVLTFSEKEPFDINDHAKVEAFLASLKEFVNKLAQQKERLERGGAVPPAKGNGKPSDIPREIMDKIRALKVEEAVFVFSSISQVMDYASILPAGLRIKSALYKMDDSYFLYIAQGSAAYDRYSKACVQALEFADLYRADAGCDELLKEHGECLIAEKAVRKLRVVK